MHAAAGDSPPGAEPASPPPALPAMAGAAMKLRGRVLMLYAGAGNKLVSRHLELHGDGQLRILLDAGTAESHTTIDLAGCMLADYPENQVLGFSLCRTTEHDPAAPSRLGQFLFMCLNIEDKRRWMTGIQHEIWRASGEIDAATGAASSSVKQSRLNRLRFSTSEYVIDRGCRPPLLQGFLLKRTGTFLQDYVVRWCELRDRVSSETTALGGIVYAAYLMAPPGEWSLVPMRIDTALASSADKNRIAISGPNQDSVFIKFDSAQQMVEWMQTLESLVDRARIENDPQFAMDLKLGQSINNNNNSNGNGHDADDVDLAQTMIVAQHRRARDRSQRRAGDGDGADSGDDIAAAVADGQRRRASNTIVLDSDDDAVAARVYHGGAASGGRSGTTTNINNNIDDDDGTGGGGSSAARSASGSAAAHQHFSEASDTDHELEDLVSDSPLRARYSATLYSVGRTVNADRDSAAAVVPLLREIVSSPASRFRPAMSPYVPRGSKQLRSDVEVVAAAEVPADAARVAGVDDDGPPAAAEPTVEDVLERFERRTAMAEQLLGPSVAVGRLRAELDADATDLRGAAQHICDTFPRQLKAALCAARLDAALAAYADIRESLLVRQDMASFREEFRIAVVAPMSPMTPMPRRRWQAVASAFSAAGVGGAMLPPALQSTGGGGGASAYASSPASAAMAAPLQDEPLTVDEALKIIGRVRDPDGAAGADVRYRVRDAMQFLSHFLSQFRETFDVFDDAGYVIEEVGNAIEGGTQFLQEL